MKKYTVEYRGRQEFLQYTITFDSIERGAIGRDGDRGQYQITGVERTKFEEMLAEGVNVCVVNDCSVPRVYSIEEVPA